MSPPRALVTCGPALEPIDSVRRITNFSTGELGTVLSDHLADHGFSVLCLRGEAATFPAAQRAQVQLFSTNASLEAIWRALPETPDVVFHAAALCDYAVAKIEGAEPAAKIRSDRPELVLTLRPAPKLLPRLRLLFPKALLVGWKYELDGSRDDALTRGRAQVRSADTDACVVNGAAYGEGFGFLEADTVTHLSDKRALCEFLANWTTNRLKRR